MLPAWWAGASAAVSGVLAMLFLLRWARRPRHRVVCGGHALMALGMAVMCSPWAFLVPPAAGAGACAVTALWTGRRALAQRPRAADGEIQLLVGSAVMTFMYVREISGRPAAGHHMAPMGGAVEVLPAVIALVCAGCLALQVGRAVGSWAVRPGVPSGVLAGNRSAAELAGVALMSCVMIGTLLIGIA